MNYTELQYKQYCKYNFFIANDDIFDSVKAHFDLKKWLREENISPETKAAMNNQMEAESIDGYSFCDLETLIDLEYISIYVMLGKISEVDVIAFMRGNNLTKLELTNGAIIKQDKIGNYFVNYDGAEIGLRLFLMLSK